MVWFSTSSNRSTCKKSAARISSITRSVVNSLTKSVLIFLSSFLHASSCSTFRCRGWVFGTEIDDVHELRAVHVRHRHHHVADSLCSLCSLFSHVSQPWRDGNHLIHQI
ncbi:hypothetical protein PS1_032549 [Malus domestica]